MVACSRYSANSWTYEPSGGCWPTAGIDERPVWSNSVISELARAVTWACRTSGRRSGKHVASWLTVVGRRLRCPGSGSAGPFTTVTLPTGGLPAADFIELKSTRWHRRMALALRQQVRLDRVLVSSGARPRCAGGNEVRAPSHAPQIMCIILWPFLLVKLGRPPTGDQTPWAP